MAFDLLQLDGVDVRSASVFAPDCSFPITDLIRRCRPDDVLLNMPVRIGNWANNMHAPAFDSMAYAIDETGATSCIFPTVTGDLGSCEFTAPNMAEIGLQTGTLNIMDMADDFCRRRSILPNQMCVFDQQGNLAVGQPLAFDFAQFVMQTLYNALSGLYSYSALRGDNANLNQFDGLYTQLSGGWTIPGGGIGCSADLNTEVVIDWNVLTGGEALACAGPDAVTEDGHQISIWGALYTVPAGLNFAQFLDRLWMEKIESEWTGSRGGVTQWEAHTRPGMARCLGETAACMVPCDGGNFAFINDPDLRNRFQRMAMGKAITLYPSGVSFPVLETNHMEANTIRFGPRSVGGRPTYGLFLDDIGRYFSILRADYGGGFGYNPNPTPLAPVTQTQLDIENRALRWDFLKTTAKCLVGSMFMRAGLLACSRHLWLKVENICCTNLLAECTNNITVDGVALGA